MKLRKLISMRDALSSAAYFGNIVGGESWAAWRVLLIAIVGEELSGAERAVLKGLTGREREPGKPVEEFWGIIGRRGGKTEAMCVLAAYLAACVDHRQVLGPGERGKLPLLAASTEQVRTAFEFVVGIFEGSPALSALVESVTADTVSLKTRIDVVIRPASWRTIRGITAVAAICDEMSSWMASDESANPAKEVLRALRPALGTTGGPLIVISSPRAKSGPLYQTFGKHYGADGHRSILVARAATRVMNSTYPQWRIDREYEEDPENAAAEYDVEWRGDLEVFVSREKVEAAVARGVVVRAPTSGTRYVAFVDPSGGSSDSMTLAIAHAEVDRYVLDLVAERRAPFSPDSVVAEFAGLLKQYRVYSVTGDRYAGEWPREAFAKSGVAYVPAEMNKSDIYLSFLPLINSGKADLLDAPRLIAQLCGLERRIARGGHESVDHMRGAHDDVANAVAGAIVLVGSSSTTFAIRINPALLRGGGFRPRVRLLMP